MPSQEPSPSENLDPGLLDRLGPDLASLVLSRDAPLVGMVDLTALPSPVRVRRAFRLDFADGSRLKGRRLKSLQQGERLRRLRPALGAGYPRILAARGDAQLAEWIEGRTLDTPGVSRPELLRRCGRMLGELHATPVPGPVDASAGGVEALLARLERDLGELREAGRIDARTQHTALRTAELQQPTRVEIGLIHKDFCAQNLVVNGSGAPVCIDNASLAVGPFDLDLARTWYRWPMSDAERRSFDAAYREQRETRGFRAHFAFWMTCVLVASAAVRERAKLGRLEEPLGQLAELLRGEPRTRSLPRALPRRGAPPLTCLRYEDFRIGLGAPDPADPEWVSDFLACGFEPAAGDEPHATVRLTIDAERYDALERRGPAPERLRAEGFAKDSKPDHFERWHDLEGARTYRSPRNGLFYRLEEDGALITLLAREPTRHGRLGLMRVARELAMEHVIASGGSLLHASAVARGEDVIAFAGPRRSGKTTLLLALLAAGRVSYVANDRAVLRVTGGTATLRGLATLVSIRADTLDFFPELSARRERLYPRDPGREKPKSLTPPELLEVAGGRDSRAAGRLRALVLPRIGGRRERVSLRALSPDQARQRLPSALFRAAQASPLGEVFAARPRPREGLDPTLDWLADHVPCYECELGGGRPPSETELAELLETLLGGSADVG